MKSRLVRNFVLIVGPVLLATTPLAFAAQQFVPHSGPSTTTPPKVPEKPVVEKKVNLGPGGTPPGYVKPIKAPTRQAYCAANPFKCAESSY